MSTRPRLAIAAMAVAWTLSLADCTPPNSARGVVDRFIEAHYIAIDLKAAQPFCTGLALEKLHKEIQLTEGQRIDESTRKPMIHYRLKSERETPGHVTFLFSATIDVPDGGSFRKNWMISAREETGVWKVSNFSEYD